MRLITYGEGGFDPKHPTGNIVDEVEIEDPPQEPLDASGALAALLATKGVLTTEEAADAVGLQPEQLVAEAEAWAAAEIAAPSKR